MVRLSTGEIALVLRVHASDPFRPAVRVLTTESGEKLCQPVDRNLWETANGTAVIVASPIDPARLALDPLAAL